MKPILVVAIFAFMAVQFSQSAPTPDEEKKEAAAVPAAAEPVASPAVAEVKSAQPEPAPASPAEPAAAEEKKAS